MTRATETTRRALLGGIGLAAVAATSAIPTPSAAAPIADADTAATDPIDAFVLWWLDRWTTAGGSVQFYDGSFWTGWPEYDFSEDWRRQRAKIEKTDWFAELPEDERPGYLQRTQTAGVRYYDGKMRAMQDCLRALPGAKDRMLETVRARPALGLAQHREARA